jgi:hypothetical protein
MFVTYLYRLRAPDAGAAVLRCERHMERQRADTYTPLCVASHEAEVRAVLVGPEDWRKREPMARELLKRLKEPRDALILAKELRISWYFHLLTGTKALRAVRKKLEDEYMSFVDGPERERTFFMATEPIVRDALRPDWSGLGGTLEEYMATRATGVAAMIRHTTDETYPFCGEGPGIDIYQSRVFDLGGEGPRYYVILDIHM